VALKLSGRSWRTKYYWNNLFFALVISALAGVGSYDEAGAAVRARR
jgi:hypothetical protein